MPLAVLRLGKKGIAKQIFLGTRDADHDIDYLTAFVDMTKQADEKRARRAASKGVFDVRPQGG